MKQYFSYFKIWFAILIFLGIITAFAGALCAMGNVIGRKNTAAPKERVYDYADVLTPTEEEKLEKLIAKRERQVNCDFVIVTINESVLASYELDTDYYWNLAMRNYADDFYDYNGYGYDEVGGDGSLLLDNWYEGEKGTWFSTGGKVYEWYSEEMIDEVLDVVYRKVESSPYLAYKAYVESVYKTMSGKNMVNLWPMILFVPFLVCIIFILVNLRTKAGEKTINNRTYINGGQGKMNDQRDVFLRKTVSQRRIETSTSSGSGYRRSSSGGRGGSHRSSSGRSHGGGGRRR